MMSAPAAASFFDDVRYLIISMDRVFCADDDVAGRCLAARVKHTVTSSGNCKSSPFLTGVALGYTRFKV